MMQEMLNHLSLMSLEMVIKLDFSDLVKDLAEEEEKNSHRKIAISSKFSSD